MRSKQLDIIKPINGQLVGSLNEHDQHTLFLMAVKLNEVIAVTNQQSDYINNLANGATKLLAKYRGSTK